MKKTGPALLFALAVLAAPGVSAASSADAELQVLNELAAAQAPATVLGRAAQFRWRIDQLARLNDLCEKFMANHPADPRRWGAALLMIEHPRIFVLSIDDARLDLQKPGPGVLEAVKYDHEAHAKHARWLTELDDRCEAAGDLPPDLRKRSALGRIVRKINVAGALAAQKKSVDLAPLRAELDRVIVRYPAASETADAFNRFVKLSRNLGASPETVFALLESYADSPSAGVRDSVQAGLRLKRAQEFPIDWKFTAADGREVDFAKLRGKVVLVDFWATWCGPCIAELPNVKKVYADYHAQGFEVIGISLENAKLAPSDTPDQTVAKLDAAKKVLTDFTAANAMPWPQQFDGKFWKNEFSTRYGIAGIPAMFLVDQEGKIVTTNARGPKLEAEVKRLLKL